VRDRFNRTILNYLFVVFPLIYSTIEAQVKIKAAGDIMLGSVTPKRIIPPDSGRTFINSVAPLTKNAHIIIGNLEGTFIKNGMKPQKCSEQSRSKNTCYEFGMPHYLAPSLKEMGFNVLGLDNNHSEDYGTSAYKFTIDLLTDLGISAIPKKGFKEFLINDKKIIVVVFGFSNNSFKITDIALADSLIIGLKSTCDILIVSFHGGAEGKDAVHVSNDDEFFLGEQRGNVYAFARRVIDAGADLVIGHGPHVLRSLDYYKNKLIAYSLGNFLTYGNISITGINGAAGVLEVELDEDNGNFIRGKFIPTRQIDRGYPIYDKQKEAIGLLTNLLMKIKPKPKLLITNNGLIYPIELLKPKIKPWKRLGKERLKQMIFPMISILGD
jgi:hypothetical protein